MSDDFNLVEIEGDEIVIRLNVSVLAHESVLPDICFDDNAKPKFRVIDPDAFALSFVHQLNREVNERGDTLITQAFDKAFEKALEDPLHGDDGVVEIYNEPFVAPLTDGPAG